MWYVGTGQFSNCKACGRKVHFKLSKCHYCREPNPQLMNGMGYRVDYTKTLDPSVSKKWRSTHRLLVRTLKILSTLTFLSILATAFVLERYPNLITKYLGLPLNPSEVGTLYAIMFVLVPVSFTFALIPND